MRPIILSLALASAALAMPPGVVAQAPTTAPSLLYGQPSAGVAVGVNKQVAADGTLSFSVRNDGVTPLSLHGAFAWLLLAQSRDKAYFTDKILFDNGRAAPGAQLSAGESLTRAINIRDLLGQPYEKGMKVLRGYPQLENPQSHNLAAQHGGQKLRAQLVVYLPANPETLLLKSPPVELLFITAIAADIPTTRPVADAPLAQIIEQFRKDAFAAKAAHDLAVKKGPQSIPALMDAIKDPAMPDFGRMWIATAIIHMGGEPAAGAASELVDHPDGAVRSTVAYYGPGLQNLRLDERILARAQAGNDPEFTAWAARGFISRPKDFPRGLIDIALASTDARARAEIAEVLATLHTPADLIHLAKLFSDENELVRVAAADAVKKHSLRNPALLKAMAQSLNMPGESARQRSVDALAGVLRKPWTYDPKSTPEQHDATLRQIHEEFSK